MCWQQYSMHLIILFCLTRCEAVTSLSLGCELNYERKGRFKERSQLFIAPYSDDQPIISIYVLSTWSSTHVQSVERRKKHLRQTILTYEGYNISTASHT